MGLGNVLFESGEYVQAEERYREALAIQRDALPTGHPRTAETLAGLGRLLLATGRADLAEPLFREALSSYEAEAAADQWRAFRVQSLLGASLSEMGP